MAKYPIIIQGPATKSARVAAMNLSLIMGLTTSQSVEIVWSPRPSETLAIHNDLDFVANPDRLANDLEYCRRWSPRDQVQPRFNVDVLSWYMWFLERHGEDTGPWDEHKRFSFAASWMSDAKVAHTPVLDELAHGLRRFLEFNLKALRIPAIRESPWPQGKAFAVALSHDIDEAIDKSIPATVRKVVAAGAAACIRADMRVARRRLADARGLFPIGRRPSPYWLMPRLAQMEAQRGYRATYFILPHTSRHVREGDGTARRYVVTSRRIRRLMHELKAMGHELALHTTYNAHSFPNGLEKDLRALSLALGDSHNVQGARSHYLILGERTHARTVEAGLEWDATVGLASGWGFRSGTSYPHLSDPGFGADNLWIVGLNLMDVAVPLDNLVEEISRLVRVVADAGGVASILVHPNPYGNATALEHLELFETVLDAVASYGDSAWVTTTSEIVAACRSFSELVCADHA